MDSESLASIRPPVWSPPSASVCLRSRAAANKARAIERDPSGKADPVLADNATPLRQAFSASGGVARSVEMVNLLRQHCDQPISVLARWIVARELVSFSWHVETFVPLFQFHAEDMSLRSEVRAVIAELSDEFDDQEVACWFARPNAWLAGAAPVCSLQHDVAGVLHAARADRFAALG